MTTTRDLPPATTREHLGGQALAHGVMIRGRNVAGVAARTSEGGVRTRLLIASPSPLARVPVLRGLTALTGTLNLGAEAAAWASNPASREHSTQAGGTSASSLLFALALWLVLPAGAAELAGPWWGRAIVETVVRIALLVGYLAIAARMGAMQRTFQYHAAEHMAIRGFELGRQLTVPSLRRLESAHPRCGTSFLVALIIVSAVLFPLLGVRPGWWRVASRLVLAPLAIGLAAELVRFEARLDGSRPGRALVAANLALQRLTTRQPDDEQLQVAIAALDTCLEAEGTPRTSGQRIDAIGRPTRRV
ncbi:MAG: DUF1385 domain-containing protein [Dehalococcoidia bacterium]